MQVAGDHAPGLLPVLRAVVHGTLDFDADALESRVLDVALDRGLGPILARVTARRPMRGSSHAARIQAADLTARLLTAEKYEVIEQIVAAAHAVGCRVALLKGASTALRYYPAPHLRTMGDIDLFVREHEQPTLEALLRALGFQQRSSQSPSAFVNWHHSMPFWHPGRDIWIDVHTKLQRPECQMGRSPSFSSEAVAPQFLPFKIGEHTALAMRHELQLIYTSTRWCETFDSRRGVYPIMDAALLLRKHSEALDWDAVKATVRGSWAVTALRLMLSYLCRWDLARVPGDVLAWLAGHDRHATCASIRLLHRLVTRHVVDAPSRGAVMSDGAVSLIWSAMTQPASAYANFLRVPYYVAFPPWYADRFSPVRAVLRLRTVVRRARTHAGRI